MKDNAAAIKRIVAGCTVLLLLSGCSLLPLEEAALKPPLVQPVKENFEMVEVKVGNITKQLVAQATFASSHTEQFYFKESGSRLLVLKVGLGDEVKPGDVMAELEKGDLESKIRIQRLNVEKAQIALEQTKQAQLGDHAAIRMKMIDVEMAQIQLANLQEQLSKTKLIATTEGVVTYVDSTKPGELISAYKTMVTVADPKQVQLVYVAGSSGDLMGLQVGMPVKVKLKSGETMGKLLQTPSSAPLVLDNPAQAEKNTKTLIIGVDNPGEAQIGASAEISIVTEQSENTLVIPRAGLRSYLGRDYVQVLEGESRKEVNVEKGIMNATDVEIRKGLKEGQQVILNN
jgi:multidrug efflux pump subunit AcrA (membrane-fusion protein)